MLLRAHVSWRLRQLRLLACLLALHVVRRICSKHVNGQMLEAGVLLGPPY